MAGSAMLERETDVERLWSALGALPPTAPRPALIVLSGLPGSGKSYLGRCLAERLPSVILESDRLRRQLFARPVYSAEENNRLYCAVHLLIERLLRGGRRVIMDATNLVEHHRAELSRIAAATGASLVVVWVEAPTALARERLRARAAGYDPENHSEADYAIYEGMRAAMEPPEQPHFVVDSSQQIGPVLRRIVRHVRWRERSPGEPWTTNDRGPAL